LATPKKQVGQVVRETGESSGASAAPPAYFLSLTVENIRCFGPAQTLDLSDGGRPARWTVILGDNGVGKTTLLHSIARCEAIKDRRPDAEERAVRQWFWYPSAGETGFIRDAKRSSKLLRTRLLAHLSACLYYGSGLNDAVPGQVIRNYCVEEKVLDFDVTDRTFIVVSPAADNLDALICYGYGATRRMGTTSLSEVREEDTSASLFSDGVTLLNAEEWLLQADYAALVESPSQEQARSRRDQIKDVLVNLLPDVTDIRFVRPTSSTSKPRVEVQTPYGWVTIKDLSLGYRALIAWIVDLAYRLFERYPDSPNPLAEPAIVLVDEIDLHLHPRWQRTIMSYLTERFPNTQFIVTAHSPLIVQAATDANIVLLRREGDHVVIDNDVEAIRNWRIDQVLTSDLFGLETARPPELDGLMAERNRILGKSKLTKADEKRLKELDAGIGDLPTGETPQDMEAMDVIRRAAEVLKREGASRR
jgi:predicted ATP-binding protein involved in virulence